MFSNHYLTKEIAVPISRQLRRIRWRYADWLAAPLLSTASVARLGRCAPPSRESVVDILATVEENKEVALSTNVISGLPDTYKEVVLLLLFQSSSAQQSTTSSIHFYSKYQSSKNLKTSVFKTNQSKCNSQPSSPLSPSPLWHLLLPHPLRPALPPLSLAAKTKLWAAATSSNRVSCQLVSIALPYPVSFPEKLSSLQTAHEDISRPTSLRNMHWKQTAALLLPDKPGELLHQF